MYGSNRDGRFVARDRSLRLAPAPIQKKVLPITAPVEFVRPLRVEDSTRRRNSLVKPRAGVSLAGRV